MSRGGSFCAVVSSMIYCVPVFILNFILYKRYKEEGYSELMFAYHLLFAFLSMIFIASICAICGILGGDRKSRLLLIPYIASMTIYIVIISLNFIQLISMVELPLFVIVVSVVHIVFCLGMDLCVICGYKELANEQRTKRNTNITGEPPVMYIAVSDRMTLPFSKGGGDGAAMYTSRVPSPEINFPINSIGGGVGNNAENESDPLKIAAPSDSRSLLPVGQALSYPSTPANNTPYLSGTINRRPMVATSCSSRSMSHLEASPPQYHILSTNEKVESIV